MKKKEPKTVRLPVYCEHVWVPDWSDGGRMICNMCDISFLNTKDNSKVQIGWVEIEG